MSEALETLGTFSTPAPSRSAVVRAYVSVSVATLLWSSNVVAVKYILRDFPALPAGALRITLAAITLGLLRVAQRKKFSVQHADRITLLQIGVVGIAASFLFYTAAMSRTSVAHAVFIGGLIPVAVLMLARMEGQESGSLLKTAGMVLCMIGVVILAFDKTGVGAGHWFGDAMAFAGVWCFALYTVRGKRLSGSLDSVALNTFAFVIAALCCLPILAVTASSVPWSQVSWAGWAALFYSGTFGSAGAYLSYYYSLRTLTSSQVAAFQYVQPVLSTCFGVLFLAETWGVGFEAGAALILVGMFLAERR